jgi:uracil-DNA glycosylase
VKHFKFDARQTSHSQRRGRAGSRPADHVPAAELRLLNPHLIVALGAIAAAIAVWRAGARDARARHTYSAIR